MQDQESKTIISFLSLGPRVWTISGCSGEPLTSSGWLFPALCPSAPVPQCPRNEPSASLSWHRVRLPFNLPLSGTGDAGPAASRAKTPSWDQSSQDSIQGTRAGENCSGSSGSPSRPLSCLAGREAPGVMVGLQPTRPSPCTPLSQASRLHMPLPCTRRTTGTTRLLIHHPGWQVTTSLLLPISSWVRGK